MDGCVQKAIWQLARLVGCAWSAARQRQIKSRRGDSLRYRSILPRRVRNAKRAQRLEVNMLMLKRISLLGGAWGIYIASSGGDIVVGIGQRHVNASTTKWWAVLNTRGAQHQRAGMSMRSYYING